MANVGCTNPVNNARIRATEIPALARLHFSTKLFLLVIESPKETRVSGKYWEGVTAGGISYSIGRLALGPVTPVISNSILSSTRNSRALALFNASDGQIHGNAVADGNRQSQVTLDQELNLELTVVIADGASHILAAIHENDGNSGNRMTGPRAVEHLTDQRSPLGVHFRIYPHVHIYRAHPIQQLAGGGDRGPRSGYGGGGPTVKKPPGKNPGGGVLTFAGLAKSPSLP